MSTRPQSVRKGRARDSESQRDRILAAACRTIVKRGFDATRIVDIATETGVSTGTIHYHFATKDDVLLASLHWSAERVYRRVDELLAREATATAQLAGVIRLSIPLPGVSADDYILWVQLWGRSFTRRDLLPQCEAVSNQWRKYFVSVLKRGERSGEFSPMAPVEETADRLVAIIDGLGFKVALGYPWMTAATMEDIVMRFAAEQLRIDQAKLTGGGPGSTEETILR